MKKTVKRILCTTLTLIMLLCSTGLTGAFAHAYAYPVMSQEQWDAYFASASQGMGLCELTPGSDESKMGFSWHCTDSSTPCVEVYQGDILFGSFTGINEPAEDGMFTNRVTVTGLLPDTQYSYSYGCGGEMSTPEAFETGNPDDFTFLYMGDVHVSQNDEDALSLSSTSMKWSNTLSSVLNTNPDIDYIISVGDQASQGLGSEMRGFYSAPALRGVSVATVIGNHEKKGYDFGYYGNKPNEYSGIGTSFIGGDYWFRYGDALFMSIDTTNGSGTDHYDFVSEAVASNPDARWRICTLHHDLYGGAYSDQDGDNKLIASLLNPVFADFDIDLVLQGHSHYYGRTHGLSNGKIIEDYTGIDSVTDPQGTVFMVCGSVNNVQYDTYPDTASSVIAKNHIVNDVLYTKINIEGDNLTIETREYTGDAVVDTLTINKSAENNFREVGDPDVSTVFLGIAGTIYTIIDKILKVFRSLGLDFDIGI